MHNSLFRRATSAVSQQLPMWHYQHACMSSWGTATSSSCWRQDWLTMDHKQHCCL